MNEEEETSKLEPTQEDQSFTALCETCNVAGQCTCSDEAFYADRATWLDAGMP